MTESTIRRRAKKLSLMVHKDRQGDYYLVDLNNCAVAPCPMTLEQIDSWLTDWKKQAEPEDKLVLFQDDLKKEKLKSTENIKMMVSAEVPSQDDKADKQ